MTFEGGRIEMNDTGYKVQYRIKNTTTVEVDRREASVMYLIIHEHPHPSN